MSAPDANGWLPIKTAPKDWSDILLFDPDQERSVFEGYYSCKDGGYRCWMTASNDRCRPKKWQHLPKPPVQHD